MKTILTLTILLASISLFGRPPVNGRMRAARRWQLDSAHNKMLGKTCSRSGSSEDPLTVSFSFQANSKLVCKYGANLSIAGEYIEFERLGQVSLTCGKEDWRDYLIIGDGEKLLDKKTGATWECK